MLKLVKTAFIGIVLCVLKERLHPAEAGIKEEMKNDVKKDIKWF